MAKLGNAVTVCNAAGNASRLIPAAEWHPLDGVPAPEYIPPAWDGPHVGLRLVDAFKTLTLMPSGTRHQKSGVWPQYRPEWEDVLAWLTAEKDQLEQQMREMNRARLMPSAEAISRMERAIVWPGHYLRHEPRDLARMVGRVAMLRARDLDLHMIARKLHRSPRGLRRANRAGLDLIATGLRAAGERVF